MSFPQWKCKNTVEKDSTAFGKESLETKYSNFIIFMDEWWLDQMDGFSEIESNKLLINEVMKLIKDEGNNTGKLQDMEMGMIRLTTRDKV